MRQHPPALVLLGLVATLLAGRGHANGLVAHLESAHRALYFHTRDSGAPYAQLLLRYPGAYQAGALFPDWGFVPRPDGKGNIHSDAAEAAHWTGFMKAATAHLRGRPKPWDARTERLAAFLAGVMSHQLTDTYWHDLCGTSPRPMGFLKAMALTDFSGEYCDTSIDTVPGPLPPARLSAHLAGDVGGEFLTDQRFALEWVQDGLDFPIDDLLLIYGKAHPELKVTREQLVLGTSLESLYVWALKRSRGAVGTPVSKYFAWRAPFMFMTGNFHGYYAGGLDDSAVWTRHRWALLMKWFSEAPCEGSYPLPADLFCPRAGQQSCGALAVPGPPPAPRESSLAEALRHVLGEEPDALTRALAPGPLAEPLPGGLRYEAGAQAAEDASSPPREEATSHAERAAASLATPYAYVGASLAVSSGTRPRPERPGPSAPEPGDFNRDGLDDLVIGAPGHSLPGRPQAGAVFIRFGRAGTDGSGPAPLAGTADLTLTGDAAHGRFGSAVAVLDLNADGLDDLAVSAPTRGTCTQLPPDGDASCLARYRGTVSIYLGRRQAPVLPATPDFVIAPGQDFMNFGSRLLAADCDGDGHEDLVVGSPLATGCCGFPQGGAVDIYLSSRTRRPGTPPEPAWSARGQHRALHFGESLALARLPDGGRVLVVGAPGAKLDLKPNTGQVQGFELKGLGGAPLTGPRPLFTVLGTEPHGRLGASLASGTPLGRERPLLAVGTSRLGDNELSRQERVLLLPLAGLRGVSSLDKLQPVATLVGGALYARFGAGLTLRDVDGNGVDDLLVTEPSSGAEAGAVYLWYGGASFPRGTVKASSAAWRAAPGERRARFGEALAVIRAAGRGGLAVASPHSSAGAPQGGAVTLLVLNPSPRRARAP